MLMFLNGNRQRYIAGFFFIVFYIDLMGAAYAYNRMINPIYPLTGNVSGAYNNTYSDKSPHIEATLVRQPDLKRKNINTKNNKNASPIINSNYLVDGKIQNGFKENVEKVDTSGPGPGQPEMSTFKSVGADNMVNLFTGDFSYNIPLLDVDGYPINIFYNAGPSMDQEASWVGLGWNINPGTINRNMRGLPDDFDGSDKVKKEMSMKPDVTVGVNGKKSREILGVPKSPNSIISIRNPSVGVFYNNKRGLGLELGISGEFTGHKNISKLTKSDLTGNDTTKIALSLNLNSKTGLTPSLNFSKMINKGELNVSKGLSTSIDFNSRVGLGDLRLNKQIQIQKFENGNLTTNISESLYGTSISFARSSYTPSIRVPITNFNASFTGKFGPEQGGKFKNITIAGYYTKSSLSRKYSLQNKDAYGYMYYEEANNNKNALMDFNRLNDGSYTKKTPVISIPVYTYDIFSITGEGTGGSFRGYRGNMGYVRDPYVRTNSGKLNVQVEIGVRQIFHGGTVIGGVYSGTTMQSWDKENNFKNVAQFKPSYKNVQSGFYFKNPGEKAIIDEVYYNNMGQDNLMRPTMYDGPGFSTSPPFLRPKTTLNNKFQLFDNKKNETQKIDIDNTNTTRQLRDKRTQVISYLTAEDADRVGLDKDIKSFVENNFSPGLCNQDAKTSKDFFFHQNIRRVPFNSQPTELRYHKKNHISEITVQEGSKRYIYGLPVYELKQQDVTISIARKTLNPYGQIQYSPGKNSNDNDEGKDGIFQKETIDPYPHSFLLTAILSPDYSDITGNGISDDDLGTAIKFNYSRAGNNPIFGQNSWTNMAWRLPASVESRTANFNRGLVTDDQDDKATYSKGLKELWYTHSIESKNMVATFTVSNRSDGWGVKDKEDGGILTNLIDANAPCQKKLDKIDLYSKADIVKYGIANAKPIKTVHFTYTYKLCKNYSMFSGNASKGNGKLTLESIYFTYSKNNHQKNKYLFKYAAEDEPANYNPVEYDRWGTYKPHTQNPSLSSNEDMPYTPQNKIIADANAATWSLNSILLPSGAKIDVNYEADDYAYVQDRRAAQMTSILGFGNSETDYNDNSPQRNKLYNPTGLLWNFSQDKRFVFFSSPVTLNVKEDVKRLYLQDLNQLLLKLWVKMPGSTFYGSTGYEPIFVYCNIENYGVLPGSNGTKFFVKVGKASRGNGSQIMETVYQFLRDQLPGKAYPGYDIGTSSAVGQVVKSLFAMVNNIRTGVTGFENNARLDGWCKEIDLIRSGVRLSNPFFKKLGGGHRVKSIVIKDNWKKMTGSPQQGAPEIDSYYGQEYEYSTTEVINGVPLKISSGVASYEPGIGNEENPFREVLQYGAHNVLGPTEISNIELPVAETFFPNPSVGYSRVTVKSIHSKNKDNPLDNKNIKSGVGMQETQFFTTKDFPTLSEWTDFGPRSRHNFKPSPISRIFSFAQKDYMTLTQGFRVVLNDMNGKIKQQAGYAENDLKNPINKTTYHYRMEKVGENKYKLNNVIPTVAGPDGKIVNKLVGKDIEVVNDLREHFSFTRSTQVPLNVDFFEKGVEPYVIPILIPTVFKAVFRDESLFRSATTLKIVNEYGILDSVENLDKGSVVGTKNLLYNAETGDVLVSRTQNEFNKPIYNFTYPAYWAVDDMGPAYKNIDAIFKGLTFRHGKIDAGLTETEVNNYFASGDEIYVVDHANGVREHPACDANTTCGNFTVLPPSSEFRIWALDVTKDDRLTQKEFIFIDRNGNPYNAGNADIRIIRSGRRNIMDASVGSITSMANPILSVNNQYDKLLINNTTDVVSTGAIEYKEKWKVQDAFRVWKEVTQVVKRAPVNPLILTPTRTYSVITGNGKDRIINGLYDFFDHIPDYNSFTARKVYAHLDAARIKYIAYEEKSWILFDLDPIGNAAIKSAKLSLYSHTDFPISSQQHLLPRRLKHFSNNAHEFSTARGFFSNDFQISRMQSNVWPSNYDTGPWFSNFYFAPINSQYNQTTVLGPWARSPEGNFDFANLSKIDVTKVVQGMLTDKYDLSKQYVTAFRISMPQPLPITVINGSQKEIRVCFNNYINGGNTGHNYRASPMLELGVIDCAHPFTPDNPEPSNPPYEIGECITTTIINHCTSVFDDNFINPYVRGLLGNWRPLKSYVYYGERREQDPSTSTNISKDGIIKDFEPFWNFAISNDKLIYKTNSTKWTWNSEITQYNRKGAELENKDPLQRFNASIYGYNEALPIAVVNNSKLRQSAYDGFEDYNFSDLRCIADCNPNNRHFKTGIIKELLETKYAHTGKYSLKVFGNDYTTNHLSIPIYISPDNNATNANTPDIKIGLVKTTSNYPTINLKGEGINGYYTWQDNLVAMRMDGPINIYYATDGSGLGSGPSDLPASIPSVIRGFMLRGGNNFQWHGKIQVLEAGTYLFASSNTYGAREINDQGEIKINGIRVFSEFIRSACPIPAGNRIPIGFNAGETKDIDITFCDKNLGRYSSNSGIFHLMWKKPCTNNFTLVPRINLYKDLNATVGSYFSNPYICTNVSTIKPLSNYLIDNFNLIYDKKMVASVWVKKGETDCRCEQYTGFNIQLRTSAGAVLATMTRKSPIIEGWQLFEAEFTVPNTGTTMELFIDNSSQGPMYIDDIRIHPFNSNMKSFVYNPYNLKPAAELDENNYATFYEYDDDGTLTRVKKETKLGVKTIQETRSSLQKAVTGF